MATNNGSPHLQTGHNLNGLYLADLKWLHPIVIAFNTSNGVWHFTKRIGADTLKNEFVPALEVNFLEKLPQLVALQIFQSSYINHEESLSHDILLHHY